MVTLDSVAKIDVKQKSKHRLSHHSLLVTLDSVAKIDVKQKSKHRLRTILRLRIMADSRQEYLRYLMYRDRVAREGCEAYEKYKSAQAQNSRLFRLFNHDHSAAPTPPLKRNLVGFWEKFKRNVPKAAEQHVKATQSTQAHHTRLFHLANRDHSAALTPLKRSLAGLWKKFKWNARKEDEKKGMLSSTSLQSRFPCSQPSARFLPFKFALTSGCAVQHHGVFGVHLYESIKYAKAAIWLINDNGERFIAGYIPTVVAKCGIFLKSKGTDVEGIFRLSGSARRIKDLQEIFDSPKLYGKDLDWSGYTVHDAANVLRRFLNQLPEPVIPLNFYERFRDPLRDYQVYAVSDVDAKSDFDVQQLVTGYQKLIQKLPPLNRQLLLYMLNILALFVSKSDQNLMTSSNLAVIFQPSILSHPSHDMAPEEYKRSQDVLTFLLENQEHFFAGMNEAAGPPQGGRRGAGRRKRKGKESSEIEHQKDGIQSERQRSFSFERSFSFDRICPENIDIRAIVHCPKNPQKRHQQWLQLFKRANKSFGI